MPPSRTLPRWGALAAAVASAGALLGVAGCGDTQDPRATAQAPVVTAETPATAAVPPAATELPATAGLGPAPSAAPQAAAPGIGPQAGVGPSPAEPPGAPAVVPPEEIEPAPARPRQSFARLAGLHRTPSPLQLEASAAIVVEADNGEILFEKNGTAVLPVASLTKLMTGLIVAQSRLPMQAEITIDDADVDRERNSRSRLRVGTSLSRAEALHLALMSSENRAAHALARTYPGGMTAFVAAMNLKARELGMDDTTFVDPTGLSNRNQSTVRDLALLVKAAAQQPMLRDYSTTPRRQVEFDGRKLVYLNSNRLVRGGWEVDLQKTGYIIEAGQCMAMVTEAGGEDVILVLLDSTSKVTRGRDATRLRDWAEKRVNDPQGGQMALWQPGRAR